MNNALKYGIMVGVIAVFFKAVSNYYVLGHLSIEFYSTLLAAFFLIAGIYLGIRQDLSRRMRHERRPHVTAAAADQLPSAPVEAAEDAVADTATAPLLSKREIEVLRLIAAGRSNEEIAAELFIAVSTVKTHIVNIHGKLDVGRRTQAIARARQLKLIS